MKKLFWIVVVLAIVVASTVRSAEDEQKQGGVFSSLAAGLSVIVKDEGTAFSISYFDQEMPLTHSVVEVHDDHIVIRDVAEVADTTIPVYSIKQIVKMRSK